MKPNRVIFEYDSGNNWDYDGYVCSLKNFPKGYGWFEKFGESTKEAAYNMFEFLAKWYEGTGRTENTLKIRDEFMTRRKI